MEEGVGCCLERLGRVGKFSSKAFAEYLLVLLNVLGWGWDVSIAVRGAMPRCEAELYWVFLYAGGRIRL